MAESPEKHSKAEKPKPGQGKANCIPEEIYGIGNYGENMTIKLQKYKFAGKFCDVILRTVITNSLFKAHALILSSLSPFFEELLLNPKHRDCKNIVLSLPEYIEDCGLEPVLSYIYSGKIHLTMFNVINIFKVAWLFKMDDVLQMCREFCKKHGCPEQEVSVASLHVLLQKDKNLLQQKPKAELESLLRLKNTDEATGEVKKPADTSKYSLALPITGKTAEKEPNVTKKPIELSKTQLSVVKNTMGAVPVNRTNPIAPKNVIGTRKNVNPLQGTILVPASMLQNKILQSQNTLTKPLVSILPKILPVPNSIPVLLPAVFAENLQPQTQGLQIMQMPANQIPVSMGTSADSAVSTPAIQSPSPSIKPSKEQKVALTKQVFDHINNMCQQNAQNGKSSRVFFIKTGKPISDIKSLVTTSLDLMRTTNPTQDSAGNEQPKQNAIPVANENVKLENVSKPVEKNDENVEQNSDVKPKCEYCSIKSDEFVKGYVVHFFQPKFLLAANYKSATRIADLNRQTKTFSRVSPANCIATVSIEPKFLYSHPMLYILHALKKKSEETNEHSIVWTDVRHENKHWRFVVTISEQYWVLERGEVRYAFLKTFVITPDIIERYKTVKQLTTPNELTEKNDENGPQRKKMAVDRPRELKCEFCALNFSSISSKARHVYSTHRERMVHDKEGFKFVCGECKEFKNRSLMCIYFHRYRDHGWDLSELVKQFHCGMCSKIEPSLLTIKAHCDRIHASSRDYTCEKCGFAFKTASLLCSHMRNVHINNLKNRCRMCKKNFKNKSALDIHTRTHTGVKPYKCDDCDYATAFRGNLKSHVVKKHKKEFPCLKPKETKSRLCTRATTRRKKNKT